MASKAFLEKAYLAYFGRPVDPTGLVAFANSTEAEVAAAFSASPESKALFGPTFGAAQINLIYLTLFGRTAETAGIDYWLHQVELGLLTPTGAAMGILAGARNADITSAANKLAASAAFTANLDTAAEIQGYAGNDAAAAARDFLKGITTTLPTQTQINTAVQETVAIGNHTVGQLITLTEAFSAAKVGTPAVMGPVMWGYNPHAHTETGVDNTGNGTVDQSGVISNPSSNNPANLPNEGPSDGGIPVADLISFLTTITGLDLKELGLIDASGQQTFANVTSLTISNAVAGGGANNAGGGAANANPQLTIGYADGSSMNAEVALGDGYFKFLNDLLFDAQGNSRLYQNVITPATSGTNAALQAIKLTPVLNNGGTLELNITTTAGDDTIVAGRLELLQGAYIDGGAGYNILEIDAKGTYAQPAELLRIQEIRVNDLPNWYTTTTTINGTYVNGTNTNNSTDINGALTNGYLNNSSYPLLSTVPHTNDSWLDLSRATALKKLVITDGGTTYGGSVSGSDQTSGNLTIVGIRNAGVEGNVTRLEGSFPDTLNLQYGQGQNGTLSLELALGDVTGAINLLQNAAVLNIDSQGVVNHMHSFFAGGSVSRMYVKGAGEFAIDQNIASSFNANTAVVIDATANTGGLNINFDASDMASARFASVTVKGTANNDVLSVKGVKAYTGDQAASNNGATTATNGKVTIDAGAGDNVVVTDGSSIVKVTTGTGDDTIFAKAGEVITILSGDGSNVINTDGSKIVTITSGAGVDNISSLNSDAVIVTAGDGNNIITTDGSKTVSITTGTGNDNISSTGSVSVVIDAGVGNNTIKASGTAAVNITTGAGNDKITAVGNDITIISGGGTDVITISGTDASTGVTAQDGALLNINTGTTGSATINFGNDQTAAGFGQQLAGVTALDGSVIAGNNVKLYIDSPTNLTQADLTGLIGNTKVVLEGDAGSKDALRITADQFKALGASAFSERLAGAGAQTGDVYIVLGAGKAFDLSSVTDLTSLSANVKLHFELQEGSNLTLTAAQLHSYLADNAVTSVTGTNGAISTSPNGTVTLTGAGNSFTVAADGDADRIFGTINDANVDNVNIIRGATGFNRPADLVTTDAYNIDSTGSAPLVLTSAISSIATVLNITGNQNVDFSAAPVQLGNPAFGTAPDFSINFSKLVGNVTGLTVKNFDDVKSVIGNNTNTRINVELNGDVGAAGNANGLVSSGVASYVVTAVDTNGDGNINQGEAATFFLCDNTKDVKVIGLHGNGGNTVTFAQVPWGLVAPTILLEGDGYANWNQGLKADGAPNQSNIGTVVVQFDALQGTNAPAVVNINNGGVALGTSSTGGERAFQVDGIKLLNAASLTVNVTEGDAVIALIDDTATTDTLKTLTLNGNEDVTVTAALPTALTTINASGVAGAFTATLTEMVGKFALTGGAGGVNLTLDGTSPFTADAGTTIDGGALGADLTIKGSVTLDKAALSHVNVVTMNQGSALTLTFDELAAIGVSHINVDVSGHTASINLVGLSSTPYIPAAFSAGITPGVLTLAAVPVVTLDPTTVLTGITSLDVPAGTVLNLSAKQFQQLNGAGTITGQGTVNITGLTQADVNYVKTGDVSGLNLGGISAKVGTITLAGDVNLAAATNLGAFAVDLAATQTLGLATQAQANGLHVTGTSATLKMLFTTLGSSTVDASHYDVATLKILNTLFTTNVEQAFSGLKGAVLVEIYNDLGFVTPVAREVLVDAGTTVPGSAIFNDKTLSTEITSLTLTLAGGVEVDGNLNLSTTTKGGNLIAAHFGMLTINSNGTTGNLLSTEKANVIYGEITPLTDGGSASIANNLKTVVINATQKLVVTGGIVFHSIDDGFAATTLDNAAHAAVTVTGSADVNLGVLNTADTNVDFLDVANNGTGHLAITLNDSNDGDALSFTGSKIDLTIAAASTVDLSTANLAGVEQITLSGATTLTLTQAQFATLGAAHVLPDAITTTTGHLNIVDVGVAGFDASLVQAGLVVDSLTMAAGVNTFSATANLSGVGSIIVPAGGTLNLTAAQFQQLNGHGTITGYAIDPVTHLPVVSTDITVNITGLTQADIGYDHHIATATTIADTGVGLDLSGILAARGTLTLASDVVLTDAAAGEAALANYAIQLASGQTVTFASSAQASGRTVGVIAGATATAVNFGFDTITTTVNFGAPFGTLPGVDVGHFTGITKLQVLPALLEMAAILPNATNVERVLANLDSSIVVNLVTIADMPGVVTVTSRSVVVDANVTVQASLLFQDLHDAAEVRFLDLTLSGGDDLKGNINLTAFGGFAPNEIGFQKLTIYSNGAAANLIEGALLGGALISQNNFLNVEIAATQKLTIGGGIVFTASTDGTNTPAGTAPANARTANLTVTGSGDVVTGTLNTVDNDVDNLVVTHTGTGALTLTLNSAVTGYDAADAITITGSATAADKVIILGNVDLSTAVISSIDSLVLGNPANTGATSATVTLTEAQALAIGAANITVPAFAAEGDAGVVNLTNFNSTAFNATTLGAGVNLGTVTIVGNPTVTLDPATNLTGASSIIVPAGTTLNMTAAQFEQLAGAGTITGYAIDPVTHLPVSSTDYTVNITGLSNAQAEIDLQNVTATGAVTVANGGDGHAGTITLAPAAGNVVLRGTDSTPTNADLGNFKVSLGATDHLTLTTVAQADGNDLHSGRSIDGLAGAKLSLGLVYTNAPSGAGYSELDHNDNAFPEAGDANVVLGASNPINYVGMDMKNYTGAFTLEVLNSLVQGQNIEQILANLPSSITVDIVAPAAIPVAPIPNAGNTNRVVVVEAGVTVGQSIAGNSLIFADLTQTTLVKTLDLTLKGGDVVQGAIDISTITPLVGVNGESFNTLTVNSTGATVNAMGDIQAGNDASGTSNELLNVVINATQDLTVGRLYLSAIIDAAEAAALVTGNTATVTVNGNHNVTIEEINTTRDGEVNAVHIVNNLTGAAVLTYTGGSPAFNDANGAVESLVLSGAGDIVFGSTVDLNAPATPLDPLDDTTYPGITSNTLSSLDAHALTGNLTLGQVTDMDDRDFHLLSGTGVTTLTVNGGQLAGQLAAGATPADRGWNFDLSTSAATSALTINGNTTALNSGALDIELGTKAKLVLDNVSFGAGITEVKVTGTNATLEISGTTDFRGLDDAVLTGPGAHAAELSLAGIKSIVLDAGALLFMSNEQYASFTAAGGTISGPGTSYLLTNVASMYVDLTQARGITALQIDQDNQPGFLALTDAQALVATDVVVDAVTGAVTASVWDADSNVATDDVARLAGDFRGLLNINDIQVVVTGDTDLSGMFLRPFTPGNFDFIDVAAGVSSNLTISDTQLYALANGSMNELIPSLPGLADLTIKSLVQDGADPITTEPHFASLTIDTAITRDPVTHDVTALAISGHAAALNHAQGESFGFFNNLLSEATSVNWNFVGSESTIHTLDAANSPIVLVATPGADTFTFAVDPQNLSGDVVNILNFDTATDVLNVNAIVTSPVFGLFGVNGNAGDLILNNGGKNIGSLFNASGTLTDADVVMTLTAANGEVQLIDDGSAVVAVSNGLNSNFANLYEVSDSTAGVGFTGQAVLIGIVQLDNFAGLNATHLI